MDSMDVTFSVFTKPWQNLTVKELGERVNEYGFDGIEFPIRPGYQVEPENAEKGLPVLARQLAEYGIKITSVAGDLNESVFAGCATAGVPVIRIMYKVKKGEGYMEMEKRAQQELDSLIPLCERYGVQIGLQNHYGFSVSNAMGIRHMIEKYDPKYVGAVWDSAHNALNGEEPELGLDIVRSHLCMVNLKNAFWRRTNGPEAEDIQWKVYYTTGRQGLASWPRIVKYLKEMDYKGVVCLTAEYSDNEHVDRLVAEDMVYAKALFNNH